MHRCLTLRKSANILAGWLKSEPTIARTADDPRRRRRPRPVLVLARRSDAPRVERYDRDGRSPVARRSDRRLDPDRSAVVQPAACSPRSPPSSSRCSPRAKLVRINRATQELEPWLAERWDASPDGLTYTLTLRDGVTWSDGTPFTSADVLFSFAGALRPADASPLAVGAQPSAGKPLAVTAPDARTVVVTFPRRSARASACSTTCR